MNKVFDNQALYDEMALHLNKHFNLPKVDG